MGPKTRRRNSTPDEYITADEDDDMEDFIFDEFLSEEESTLRRSQKSGRKTGTPRRTTRKPNQQVNLDSSTEKRPTNSARGRSSRQTSLPEQSPRKVYSKGQEEKIMYTYGTDEPTFQYGKNLVNTWKQFETAPGAACFEKGSMFVEPDPSEFEPPKKTQSFSDDRFGEFSNDHLPLLIGNQEAVYNLQPLQVFDGESRHSLKKEFLVNTGIHLTSLSWLPTKEKVQYVAAGGLLGTGELAESIFTSTSGRNQIQIWKLVDERELSLHCTLWHDWGSNYQLQWSPCYIMEKDILGYLGIVASDGKLRVVSVPSEISHKNVFINEAEYTLQLPHCLISCFAWVSTETEFPKQLLVGCSNGYIALWDIVNSLDGPLFYIPIHDSYIHAITQCSNEFRTMFVTAAYDCYTRIIDIRNPEFENKALSHKRDICYAITWSNLLQSVISSTESQLVVIESIRGLTTQILDERHGSVMCLGTSKLHPFVAIGSSDGIVTVVNPFRLLGFSHKHRANVHRISQLEYSEKQQKFRFLNNFRPGLMKSRKRDMYIFPWQIQINSLEWNPNYSYGGWLASGMACGLLRLEDLSAIHRA
ncbi:transcription factor tfiiic complex subunit sfc6 [Schizosaccharomyces cryophilus OY26]|uniref:Transcription factor tfiiic complex subunit sfc6 n=1 Tax=Schizosaccharomyces cryophilus (strain OY26 / ATCC MYA-4695 / CBS 11777 / NBRC 106824 / NRRL Y48691) TaxID=653667 RepID=S9W6T2_SCHCR|nr:transcription factor tfiiic complex subunit sfc6 [Schizosaccharomyces cryophilus OY26]EPY54259.1 transcription factor tfiiic complex subunit sfc6 [Schizosaccharomyces cryophilus OY26]